MISHHNAAPLSWELKINIYEFDIIEHPLRVTGDMHIGGVIFQLVEQLSQIRQDWSDFALWWPDKNMWLNKTKYTLDQYGVQADANLFFTRMHKSLKIQLPDQQTLEINADFSINVFNAVKQICKDFGIRHFEEVSLLRTPLSSLEDNNKKKDKYKSTTSKSNVSSSKLQTSKSTILNTNSKNQSASKGYSKEESNMMISSNKENSLSRANGSISSTSSTLNNSMSNNSNDTASKLIRQRSLSLSIDNGNGSLNGLINSNDPQCLSLSPIISTQDYLNKHGVKYKSIFDKARINSRWLDSSKSFMEQNVRENDLVQLRFKYFAFFDLNLKYDIIRINQIYEQAKWCILSEEIDCTEQELIHFAALQLQIQLQTKCLAYKSNESGRLSLELMGNPATLERNLSTISSSTTNSRMIGRLNSRLDENSINLNSINSIQDEDDVDTALSKLEKSLDVIETVNSNNDLKVNKIENEAKNSGFDQQTNHSNNNDISNELAEELFLMKNQKYTFKKFRSYYFTLNDTHYLSYYKSKEESKGKPIDKINLRSCELVPDVNVAGRKFGIILKVPSPDGMNELSLRCPNEESYASWMSACKLASKNKPISDATYLNEVKSILNLLQIQQKKPINISNVKLLNKLNNKTDDMKTSTTRSSSGNGSTISSSFSLTDNAEVQATNLLPYRMIKKHKLKQLNDRVLEAYSTISDLDLFEAKWKYIKAWQALPNYGMSNFIVKVKGSRFKEEIICVTSNRLLRLSPEGETIKSWRFNTMKSWNVNWEIKQFEILFEDEHLVFICMNCDPKILHEFIGCYIYLSLRVKDKPDTFSEEMFFKLTEKR